MCAIQIDLYFTVCIFLGPHTLSCCRHCLLNCGPVMTELMWWQAAQTIRRAFDVTLYPLRQLMTPFHASSENFYGDVGQVKVAVRRDSTPRECVRLQQLARQVTLTH